MRNPVLTRFGAIQESGATAPPVGLLTDPEIFIASAPGGNENGPPTILSFTVTLSAASSETVTVGYRYILAGTATGDDQQTPFHVPSVGVVTFNPGETSKTIKISLQSDNLDERDEHFVAELYNPQGGHFAAFHPVLRASAVIRDDDGATANLSFFVSDPVLIEGDAGQHTAQFEIRLSRPAGPAGLVFNYTTRDGSAVNGSDYVGAAGTVTFSDGQEIAYVNVAIKGDTTAEHSESFFLDVTPPPIDIGTDGSVGEAQVLDDDSAAGPVISLLRAGANVEDSSNGVSNATEGFAYHIILSEPSATPVTVSYRLLLAGTGINDDLGTAGNISTGANNNKTVTFAPGETSKTVHIAKTQADANDEFDEHFVLELYNPSGASFAGGVPILAASGVVLDTDGPGSNLAFFVSDPIVSEGDAGNGTALFEIRLSRPAPTDLTFDWTVAPGTATASSDYVGVNNSVTIVQGQDVAFVRVTVKGDTVQEGAETFRLIVTPPAGSGLSAVDAVGEATILADDFVLPAVTLQRAEPSGENWGSLRWIVTLSEPSATPVTVSYRTLLGTANEDDVGTGGSTSPANNGTLTFAPGETSKSIIIEALGAPGLDERDENLVMELFSPIGAVFETGAPLLRASGVILDSQAGVANPAIFVSDPVILEGDAGTKFAIFEVRLSQPPTAETVFSYTTSDGTALAGSDYIARSGNLVFAPGQDVATVTVQIHGDTASEISESFSLIVTPPVAGVYALAGAAGEATLIDDDATPPTITISPVVAAQEDFVLHRFTVTLSKPAASDVTVQWAASPGTTTAGDLTSTLSGTLTIPAGQTSGQILITPDPDGLAEFDETYFVTLTNPTGAVFAGGAASQVATGIVLDNDGAALDIALFSPGATAKEGLGVFTPLEVVVRLTRPSETALTFTVAAQNGTALAGSDFDLVDTTLTFAPGQTIATVTVNIRSDILAEAAEAFSLTFAPSGATVMDAPSPVVDVTILDGPGTPGNDTIVGTSQADGINGLAGNDSLTGAGGNDTLDGSTGNDTMTGGPGNDRYYVDTGGDMTIETAGGGTDTVYSLVTRTLGADLEHLVLLGTKNAPGTGNTLNNSIQGNVGNNVLHGLDGNDTLNGGGGEDELRGEAGVDVLTGGAGNDRFFVDVAGDQTIEAAGEGNDTVFSLVSRTLGANLEILRLQGTAALNGTGNELNNVLSGNSGANLLQGLAGNDLIAGNDGLDTLSGGEGNDTLSGGSQADVFRFAAANAGADTITDFNKNADRFQLSGGSFTNLITAPDGDVILTHNGGTIRIDAPLHTLTLAQYNALVIPGGENGTGLASAYHATILARLQSDIVHIGGDWVYA